MLWKKRAASKTSGELAFQLQPERLSLITMQQHEPNKCMPSMYSDRPAGVSRSSCLSTPAGRHSFNAPLTLTPNKTYQRADSSLVPSVAVGPRSLNDSCSFSPLPTQGLIWLRCQDWKEQERVSGWRLVVGTPAWYMAQMHYQIHVLFPFWWMECFGEPSSQSK